jgi:HSP20 family protein
MLPVKSNLLPTVSRFFEDDWNNIFDWTNRNFKPTHSTMPSVNIEHEKDFVLIQMAAPGMNKEDIKVELKNNILSISGKSESHNHEEDGKKFSIREFNYSSFHRSFDLNNAGVDDQKIDAHYKDGLLSIRLEKKEEAKEKAPVQIAIK